MKNLKRFIAIACIILLVGMYVVTLILAITDSSASMNMFKGCVACTIFIPLVAYCYICLHKYAMTRSGRKNYYEKDIDTHSQTDNDSFNNSAK